MAVAGGEMGMDKTLDRTPIVWTIAGSDSGGGAGIQADLHTIAALGGYGCSVISAVTAQNSVAVRLVEAVSDAMFLSQLESLADDMPADVIKIGLISTVNQVEMLAQFLAELAVKPYVIYDPIAVASSGANMAQAGLQQAVLDTLLPHIDLLTPNADELEILTKVIITSSHDIRRSAKVLLDKGCGSILIKGGHLELVDDVCMDFWTNGEREIVLGTTRIDSPHSHGTGCSLSSAIATVLALDYPIEDALVLAKAYLNQGLKAASAKGKGPGPVAHLGWPTDPDHFPDVILPGSELGRLLNLKGELAEGQGFASCDTDKLGLYPVVDSVAWCQKLLDMGIKTLQLRIKDKTDAEVEADVIAAIALGKQYQARMFINDYWQLAIKHGAYGVHLGQEDLNDAVLPQISRAGLRLGLSTHGYYEMLRAKKLKPSYIALGHIFPTQTKDMPSRPQGLVRLEKYAALMNDIPTVAIGGINLERAPQVWQTGVGSIAVVTAITLADDAQAVVNAFNAVMES